MNDHSSPWTDHRDELLERVVRHGRARKRQRRALGITAAAMVLVVAIGAGLYLPGHRTSSLHVAPPGPRATTTTNLPGPPPGVFLVGDSVMLGAKGALEHAIPGAHVDAGVSRQFVSAIPILENAKKLGDLPQTVVVYFGTNGRIADGAFDGVMQAIGPERTVYFLTVNVPRPWEFDVNDALSSGATRWPNAHVLEWKDHTRGHPTWFTADGFHLAPAGQAAFADFVSRGIRTPPAPSADPFTGSAIPATGFVVMDNPKVEQPQAPSSWTLTLFDDSGAELGTLPRAIVGDDVLNAQRHELVADDNGVHLAAQPLDAGRDLPGGCTQTEQVPDLAVALCGTRSGDQLLGDRIVVNPGHGWIPLIGKPPVKAGVRSTGKWEWASPSPDARWVLAGWSAECEVVTELLISVADGSVRAVTGEAGTAWTAAPESGGLGWTPDGSAIAAFGGGDTGCGTSAPVQRGIYLVSPTTGSRRLLLALTPSQGVLRWDAVDDQRNRAH